MNRTGLSSLWLLAIALQIAAIVGTQCHAQAADDQEDGRDELVLRLNELKYERVAAAKLAFDSHGGFCSDAYDLRLDRLTAHIWIAGELAAARTPAERIPALESYWRHAKSREEKTGALNSVGASGGEVETLVQAKLDVLAARQLLFEAALHEKLPVRLVSRERIECKMVTKSALTQAAEARVKTAEAARDAVMTALRLGYRQPIDMIAAMDTVIALKLDGLKSPQERIRLFEDDVDWCRRVEAVLATPLPENFGARGPEQFLCVKLRTQMAETRLLRAMPESMYGEESPDSRTAMRAPLERLIAEEAATANDLTAMVKTVHERPDPVSNTIMILKILYLADLAAATSPRLHADACKRNLERCQWLEDAVEPLRYAGSYCGGSEVYYLAKTTRLAAECELLKVRIEQLTPED